MNKYQKYILNSIANGSNFVFSLCCPTDSENSNNTNFCGTFNNKLDSFNITQVDDITKTQYVLIIDLNNTEVNPFEAIFVRKNNQWIEIPFVNKQYRIIADFVDRIDAIKFSFGNKIADDYTLSVTYTEADKEKYYAKLEQEKMERLLTAAAIKVSTGADLVNIYFQPCCDEYDHTEIKLYVPKDYVTVGGPHGPVQKPSSWSIIKKCDVLGEDFYKSINGLAYGKYAFILKQFDKNNQLLLETDYIEFSIKEPEKPEFGHWNFI
ncbi:MAG: hypothetical protein SOR23_05755 [Candidatus Enterosoma sp.]|nr:hypothetical protein [Bacilli bacterium]MDD7180925.1 hypothetical protein [Bacilli bacterium]MDY3047720.1 hypothetical protein [Candidatus Enterosoma sp.]